MSKFIKLYEKVRVMLEADGQEDESQQTPTDPTNQPDANGNVLGQDQPPQNTSDDTGVPEVSQEDYENKLNAHANNLSQFITNFKQYVANPENTLDSIRSNENFKKLDTTVDKDNLDNNLNNLNSLFSSNPTSSD